MNLDNYIRLCKCDDYKRYMWIEINLCKENLYIAACDILHEELNYYSRFGLEHDDSLIDVYQDILAFENLGKVLIMRDFNAKVGKYQ